MEEEKDKLFIKPLIPVLVDENIIYSDDVYFKTFNLIIKNLDKKTIKKIIKNFYREAIKYSVTRHSKNDIKKKYEHLKRLFNIKIIFLKNLNFTKKTDDLSSKELKNNDISSKNKHYDEACKYHEANKISAELNHFLKILDVGINIENEIQELNKQPHRYILNEKEKEEYDLKSYVFLETQLKEKIIINKPSEFDTLRNNIRKTSENIIELIDDKKTEINNLINNIRKTSENIITKLTNSFKEYENIIQLIDNNTKEIDNLINDINREVVRSIVFNLLDLFKEYENITELIDDETTEIDNLINDMRESWKKIVKKYNSNYDYLTEINDIYCGNGNIYDKSDKIKTIYNLLKNNLKNIFDFIAQKFENIFNAKIINNFKDGYKSNKINRILNDKNYKERKENILNLLDYNVNKIEENIEKVNDNFIEIEKQSKTITKYVEYKKNLFTTLLIIDQFINWIDKGIKNNDLQIQLNKVKWFKNNEDFIIETNKLIKFRQILNSFIEFLTKQISINNSELIFINEECYNLENEINLVKKNEIIEEICKNNRLIKLKQSLTEIEEINSVFINIFRKLKKDNFLNSILDEYKESFNEQKEKISQNKKLIQKIFNIISVPKKLIKINEIYEETKNKFLFYNDVNNIAITGPYGSGKSSIIKTYLDRNLDLQNDVIRITLTHFSYSNKNNNKSNTIEQLEECYPSNIIRENAIEEEIISELVYQIDPKNIYLSPYKIKKNIKPWWLILLQFSSVFLFLIYLFLVIYLPFICHDNFFCETDFWKNVLIFSPLTFLLFPALYLTLKNNKSEVTKIKLLNQIDIDFKQEKCNLSKFDKEYRELVYIIKNSKKRIIIFEDFDRLENFNFLTKLRKINDILNRDKSLNATRFKFIYVMKDDLFINPEDKTKFFDLIIPIVPFKNVDNIKNIFKKSLSKFFENNEFILNISEYISDNRLAVNICNEFNIYFEKIKTNFAGADIDLNMEDFFLLIVFKNIFPELFNLVFSNNKKNLGKKINNKNSEIKELKYKELYKKYYLQFNNISYEDFYTYTSDYFVEESDKNWLIYLNKPKEKFDPQKHNLIIKDFDYIIRFSKLNLVIKKEIEDVIKNVNFLNKLLFKLGQNSIDLKQKEKELIFNYFLFFDENNKNNKKNENSKKTLTKFFKENEKNQKLTFNFLMNFFTNIIKNDYKKYKKILFDVLISCQELEPNIFLLIKITFLYSLIFCIENNYPGKLFTGSRFEDFFKNESEKEKEFLLFLNSNPYHYGIHEFIENNNMFLESVNLYDEEHIKYLVKFIDEKNLFVFAKNDLELDLKIGSKGINYYFEMQKHFSQLFLITNEDYFNYGRILSELKEYKNIYNYYFNFVIDNFIYFLADEFNRRFGLSISEDEDIILQILNSDKLKPEYKEIYISYIEEETLNKIDSNEIKNEKIRDFFEKQKNEKNKY